MMMKSAYKVAVEAVRHRWRREKPGSLEVLGRVPRGAVAVYSGQYDQTENLLELLGVPRTVDPRLPSLLCRKRRIIFVNCGVGPKQKLIDLARAHVEGGGWLVTSDWAMRDLLTPAFPNTVRWNQRSTGDELVSVEPDRDSLWAEIVVPGTCPRWWLWGSHPIEVLDRERVRIEAASYDLMRLYGEPVVAVSFPWGAGHVFHVISHFWAKRSDVAHGRHGEPGAEFLRLGMRLDDEQIADAFGRAKVEPESLNFASLQSAVTATELAAELCVRALA